MNPNLKYIFWGRGRRGGGARVSQFFYKESKSKKRIFFLLGGGGGGGVDGQTDEQAQTNLLLQHLQSWWHNNA